MKHDGAHLDFVIETLAHRVEHRVHGGLSARVTAAIERLLVGGAGLIVPGVDQMEPARAGDGQDSLQEVAAEHSNLGAYAAAPHLAPLADRRVRCRGSCGQAGAVQSCAADRGTCSRSFCGQKGASQDHRRLTDHSAAVATVGAPCRPRFQAARSRDATSSSSSIAGRKHSRKSRALK